jgi:hypothetical protein
MMPSGFPEFTRITERIGTQGHREDDINIALEHLRPSLPFSLRQDNPATDHFRDDGGVHPDRISEILGASENKNNPGLQVSVHTASFME